MSSSRARFGLMLENKGRRSHVDNLSSDDDDHPTVRRVSHIVARLKTKCGFDVSSLGQGQLVTFLQNSI